MKRFNTFHNYEAPEPRALDQTELTIPGQEISIPEVLRRLEANIAVPVVPMDYDPPDMTIPRFKIKDLTDLEKARTYINFVQSKIDAAKAEKDDKARNERIRTIKPETAQNVDVT